MARILLVDDDQDIRMVVRTMLSLAGFAVVAESSNGETAVRQASLLKPDVVVLDVQMPGMSGDLAAPSIRSVSPRSKIVAFSAHLSTEPLWADAWLSKAKIGALAELIEELIRAVDS